MRLEEYVDAATLAKEAAPECKHFIYCYKDTALNKYHPPFINDKEPAYMVDGVRASVIKGVIKPKEAAGTVLCFVGTFELNTGKIDAADVPAELVNLDILFEKLGVTENEKVC